MKGHPYTRYAEALIRLENQLDLNSPLMHSHLISQIKKGLSAFRLRPIQSLDGKSKINYEYAMEEKGYPEQGIFLSPTIISSEERSKNIWLASHKLLELLSKNPPLNSSSDLTKSIAPTAGEYTSFALPNKGKAPNVGRGKPRTSLLNTALNTITTLTPYKPALRSANVNYCIIPDLPMTQMIDFIEIFKYMLISQTQNLFVGNVLTMESGKGKNKNKTPVPKRPLIFNGNFPNPPRNGAFGSVALLAAIGLYAKEAEVSRLAQKVLDSLIDVPIYIIKYGSASTFSFNHHVVDLAKEGRLSQIISGIYSSQLYGETTRARVGNSVEYQKYDLFTNRFLMLFSKPSFIDFISFRAEYPNDLEILLQTFFNKVEMIDVKIVSSARDLGRWLNQVAYFAAKREVKAPNNPEDLRKAKAKFLVELESSALSAKTGPALIAQITTRAGRLSHLDAPANASLFMEKTASGELDLDSAKNLIVAFSRLMSNNATKDQLNVVYGADDDIEDDFDESVDD